MEVFKASGLRLIKQASGSDIPSWDDWQESDEDVFTYPLQIEAEAMDVAEQQAVDIEWKQLT